MLYFITLDLFTFDAHHTFPFTHLIKQLRVSGSYLPLGRRVIEIVDVLNGSLVSCRPLGWCS